MKKLSIILGLAVVFMVGFVVLGSSTRPTAVSDDSPAFGVALSEAIRALDGAAQSTLNPTRVGVARAQGQITMVVGEPTCDGTVTCQAFPTFVPVTCQAGDPECDYPQPFTQNPSKCDPAAPTWDGAVTCHVGSPDCNQPTMIQYRTCDAQPTCDGTTTCNGNFTHWNSTCSDAGQTCDGSSTCAAGQPGAGPFTCTHFTVDGSATCSGVATCRSTCDQWYTCNVSAPTCAPTSSKKTTWGSVKKANR